MSIKHSPPIPFSTGHRSILSAHHAFHSKSRWHRPRPPPLTGFFAYPSQTGESLTVSPGNLIEKNLSAFLLMHEVLAYVSFYGRPTQITLLSSAQKKCRGQIPLPMERRLLCLTLSSWSLPIFPCSQKEKSAQENTVREADFVSTLFCLCDTQELRDSYAPGTLDP